MDTIEIKIYDYSELSDEAKEKARAWYCKEFRDDQDRPECVTEHFAFELEKRGLPIDNICWSLSYCQGDGMAFYGDIDLEKFLEFYKIKGKWRILFDDDGNARFDFSLHSNTSFYSHYNTMSCARLYGVSPGEITKHQELKAEEFREDLLSAVKELSRELEPKGYEILEGFESVEYVEDAINGNEWKFTEDGTREHML